MKRKGLHARNGGNASGRTARPRLAIALVSLLALASVLATVAYMQAQSSAKNAFTVAELNVEVDEKFANNVKEDVTVKNDGDVPAYVRAAIVVCWKDADGSILSDTPKPGQDYEMEIGKGWTLGSDGYWYCPAPVAANAASPTLIVKCAPKTETSGKRLCVDILAQGVQAEPSEAVASLWGASVDGEGKLTPATEGVMTP